ncbi:aldo/Keto reductase [Arthrobacter sp. Hiyo6]|nr:aldo/Keto reductase [Arthrobacter sp. Hiyo6]
MEPYLDQDASRIVEAVAMAARGLGRSPLDVSLSWLLAQHGVATAIVGPRTLCSLKRSWMPNWRPCRRKSPGLLRMFRPPGIS